MYPPVQAEIAFGERALASVEAAMQLIKYDATKRPHVYLVTLHASIVQLCGGCLAVAKSEYTAGIPVLLRSVFEALIDLENLARDPSYYERMDASNLDQYLKLLRDSPTNPMLSGLDTKHQIPRITSEYQAQLDELRSRNRGQKNLRSRCVDVGREDEYQSTYVMLCMDAHNNVGALIDRHITDGGSDKMRVTLTGDNLPMGLARRLHFAIGWMLQSANIIHSAYRTGFDGLTLLQEHEALRPKEIGALPEAAGGESQGERLS